MKPTRQPTPKKTAPEPPRGTALPIVLLLAFSLLPLAAISYKSFCSPEIAFIHGRPGAQWIMYPTPLRIAIKDRQWVPEAAFSKEFTLAGVPASAELAVTAFGEARIFVNDVRINPEEAPAGNWKKVRRYPVAERLRAGANRVRIELKNPQGPALLWARLEGAAAEVATDASWDSEHSGLPPAKAIAADDTRLHPGYLSETLPAQILARNAGRLGLMFLAFIFIYAACRWLGADKKSAWFPAAALTGVHLAWFYLFFKSYPAVSFESGFDAAGHLDYIRHLLDHGRLPDPGSGWEAHQPPLFYLLSAGLVRAFGMGSGEVLKVIPFISGLAQVWAAFFLARRLFNKEPLKVSWAVLAAGFLPMNLYMSAYVSNESLHGALAAGAIVACASLLGNAPQKWSVLAAFGVLAGLALLTKFTAVVVIVICLAFLAAKRAAALIVPAAAIAASAGWFYAGNLIRHGRWLAVDWNQWWQDPGFHTWKYFFLFGQSLKHPHFSAAFHSLWDGLYSTLWGDGLGAKDGDSHAIVWNADPMMMGYLLAIPAALLIMAGLVAAAAAVFRKKEAGFQAQAALLVSVSVCGLYSIAYFCLQAPFWTSPKAFYALYLVAPLSVFFALGAERAVNIFKGGAGQAWRASVYGWLATLAAVFFLTHAI